MPSDHRSLDGRGRQVHDGDAVGLLDRDVGLARRRVDGDVLRLEVLRDREVGRAGAGVGAAAVDADALRETAALERVEVGEGNVALGGRSHRRRERHDRDRALGVDRVVVGRLALVGHHGLGAVGRDGDHVGQRAYAHRAERRTVTGSVEEHQPAVVGLGVGLDRHHTEPVLAHGDGVGDGTVGDDGAVVGGHAGGLEVEQLGGVLRVGGVEHLDPGLRGVHHQEPVERGVELDDLGCRLVEDAGVVAAERVEPERGPGGGGAHRVVDDGGARGGAAGEGKGGQGQSGGHQGGGRADAA